MSVPVPDPAALGPLAPLIGEWEGNRGSDDAYVYAHGREESTRFRELSSFTPAGPAHNGAQALYRLDYKTTAWRMDEETPFHTEIGYWFWDAEHELVMRAVITPRGIVVLAGGSARPGDTTLTVSAEAGAEGFGILSTRTCAPPRPRRSFGRPSTCRSPISSPTTRRRSCTNPASTASSATATATRSLASADDSRLRWWSVYAAAAWRPSCASAMSRSRERSSRDMLQRRYRRTRCFRGTSQRASRYCS